MTNKQLENSNLGDTFMSEGIKEWIATLIAILVIVAIASSAIAFARYYDGKQNSAHLIQYIDNKSKIELKDVYIDLSNCEAHSHNWVFDDCVDINRDLIKSVIDIAIERNELDLLWSNGLKPLAENSRMIYEHVRSGSKLSTYNGKIPEIQYHQAIAFLKENNVPAAYKILISLQKTEYKKPAAGYIRGIFKFYGCISEHDIWGEITEISSNVSDLTQTENYPGLATMPAEEIIEKRLKLAKGDVNIIGTNCPFINILNI